MKETRRCRRFCGFDRDKVGAVVFAHKSALAPSLPVVSEGAVVKTFSMANKEVTRTAKQ